MSAPYPRLPICRISLIEAKIYSMKENTRILSTSHSHNHFKNLDSPALPADHTQLCISTSVTAESLPTSSPDIDKTDEWGVLSYRQRTSPNWHNF